MNLYLRFLRWNFVKLLTMYFLISFSSLYGQVNTVNVDTNAGIINISFATNSDKATNDILAKTLSMELTHVGDLLKAKKQWKNSLSVYNSAFGLNDSNFDALYGGFIVSAKLCDKVESKKEVFLRIKDTCFPSIPSCNISKSKFSKEQECLLLELAQSLVEHGSDDWKTIKASIMQNIALLERKAVNEVGDLKAERALKNEADTHFANKDYFLALEYYTAYYKNFPSNNYPLMQIAEIVSKVRP